jgi:hypothetical protein
MWTVEQLLAWGLTTLVSAFVGSYLAAYLKKKGENLATHEDISKLVDQVRAVTTATSEIEAKISDTVWDRQKRWELKRDVLIDIVTKTAAAKNTLVDLHSIYLTEKQAEVKGLPEHVVKQLELGAAWSVALNDLERMVFIASLACGADVVTALAAFTMFTSNLGVEIMGGQPEAFMGKSEELATRYHAISTAMRKEIGSNS